MDKKYKFDIEKAIEDKERNDFLELMEEAAKYIGDFDIKEYSNDSARISVFRNAGSVLKHIIDGKGKVFVDKQEDTVGGEITVNVRDIVLNGDKLKMFIGALGSANSIEFTSFIDGHTELGLIYTDLKKKGINNYAS